jgi:hypothetical protein
MFLILSVFLSTKSENRRAEQVLSGKGEVAGKGVGGGIWCKQCIHMYLNAKMIPVETAPGIRGGGGGRAVKGVNSNMICLIHRKNLCKCSHPVQQ